MRILAKETTSPLKIGMVGPSYPFKGGIAQYTTQFYRELAACHHVRFVSFKRQYPAWVYPGQGDIDPGNTDLLENGAVQIIDSLNPLSWRKAVHEICDFDPDVVIFPWWVIFWSPQFIYMIRAIRRRKPGVRVFFLCHNVIAHEPSWLSQLVTRLTLKLGDGFILHSDKDKRDLQAMLGRPRVIQVEHPGYEVSDVQLNARENARRKLALEGDVVLFFGFVRPYKGLHILLEAMSIVLEQHPCTLVVAGEIWGDPEVYTEHIEKLGMAKQVRLIGAYIPQQDLPAYLAGSDLVVLPYLSATGSGVVKLAYSYHRPVVVTNVGSLPDAVIPGKTGYVVPPGDAHALAQSILEHFRRTDTIQMEELIAAQLHQFGWEPVIRAVEQL